MSSITASMQNSVSNSIIQQRKFLQSILFYQILLDFDIIIN